VGTFSFGGKTIVAPGILVSSQIGALGVLQLLPFGKVAMVGPADGGTPGTVYSFNDTVSVQRVLRAGPLCDALLQAAQAGASAGFVALVAGTKVAAFLALVDDTVTLTAGDEGAWTNSITYQAVAGTTEGTFAVTITYPDALSGQTVYVGGLSTAFDNLTTYAQLAAAIAKNLVLTPGTATGLPPIVVLTITTDANITAQAKVNLASGAGGGAQTLVFADYKAAIDVMIDVDFDIGHIVGAYDLPTQAYADAQAVQVSTFGRMRRFFHQVKPTGLSAANLKTINSAVVSAALIDAATAINSIRSSVVAQQVNYSDSNTGNSALVDAAPFLCGLASLLGATGANGPASPLTYEYLPGVTSVDYPILRTTNDVDNAITAGGICLETIGTGAASTVRIVQSVTTAPNDSSGKPWVFGEFSVVRVADALLANCIAALTAKSPKTIGGGNTIAIMQAALAEVRDVLEDALAATWITDFDPTSISIYTTGIGEDDILSYSAAPTVPLNHIGIDQTLLPFQALVSVTS
jgi:hypothetical protein